MTFSENDDHYLQFFTHLVKPKIVSIRIVGRVDWFLLVKIMKLLWVIQTASSKTTSDWLRNEVTEYSSIQKVHKNQVAEKKFVSIKNQNRGR